MEEITTEEIESNIFDGLLKIVSSIEWQPIIYITLSALILPKFVNTILELFPSFLKAIGRKCNRRQGQDRIRQCAPKRSIKYIQDTPCHEKGHISYETDEIMSEKHNHECVESPTKEMPWIEEKRRFHYGLAIGEALYDSELENDTQDIGVLDKEIHEDDQYIAQKLDKYEDDMDDVTTIELRRLQESKEFLAWCRRQGMAVRDLELNARRLALYRKLRDIDLETFLSLIKSPVYSSEIEEISWLEGITEYILSNIVLAFIIICQGSWMSGYGPETLRNTAGLLGILGVFYCIRQWFFLRRPTCGNLFGMWYISTNLNDNISVDKAVTSNTGPIPFSQSEQCPDSASGWRIMIATLLELSYIVVSLGIGIPISIMMRFSGDSGTVGERFVGIRAVKERCLRMA